MGGGGSTNKHYYQLSADGKWSLLWANATLVNAQNFFSGYSVAQMESYLSTTGYTLGGYTYKLTPGVRAVGGGKSVQSNFYGVYRTSGSSATYIGGVGGNGGNGRGYNQANTAGIAGTTGSPPASPGSTGGKGGTWGVSGVAGAGGGTAGGIAGKAIHFVSGSNTATIENTGNIVGRET